MSTVETARKFHFLREIASGGFGRVYLAKVVHADGFTRLCAIKVLHPKWTENEEIASRMRDEARLLGMLRHKNIVDVIDLTRIDGRVAVLMEYLEAVDLKVLISEAKKSGERIPLRAMLEVGSAVASALDAAYNRPPYAGDKPLRVIHRDIKPSNIMVDSSGLAKVLDFGVARAEFDTREARTQELSFGSVEYMSPERLFFEPESPASDVYSLGAMLYETLAREKFGKAKLRADAHERFVAERFDDLLERYPQASEEVEDLLHDLFYDLLAFEESARPTAAATVTRLRAFARSLDGPSLEEWAEAEIPALVQKYQDRPQRRRGGDSTSLVDRVLTEDTMGFAAEPVEVVDELGFDEGDFENQPTVVASDIRLEDLAALTEAEPEPWAALQRATLKGLAGEGLEPSDTAQEPDGALEVPSLQPPPVPDGLQIANVRDGAVLSDPPPRQPQMHTPVIPAAREQAPASQPKPDPEVAPKARMDDPLGAISPAADAWQTQEPEDEPENNGVWIFAVLAGFMLLVGGLAGLAAVVGVWWYASDNDAPAQVVIVAPTEPVDVADEGTVAPDPAQDPVPAAIEEDAVPPEADPAAEQPSNSARFVSLLADTRKVSVRCSGGRFEGTDEVVVTGDPIGTCTVTAMGPARKRLTAVVPAVEAREYRCFEGDENSCE